MDIFGLADFGLGYLAKKSEIQAAELFFATSRFINIDIDENSVKNSESGEDQGVSIRMIDKRGSLGFSFTNRITKKHVEKIIGIAYKMTKVGTEDPDFKNLPESCEFYEHVPNLYDKNIKHLSIEESINPVKDLIRTCDEDDMTISQSGHFGATYNKAYIFNSNGLNVHSKQTACSVSSQMIVKDEKTNDTSVGFDYQTVRRYHNINAIEIARNSLESAKRNLNRIKIQSGKLSLILTPKATISMILKPVASAVNAETFQRNRSFLVDKRGEKIGSDLLSIHDNALIDGAVGSASFDGEGVPCKNKTIINNGVFQKAGLLHNSYTAGKERVESTGNAVRSSYSTTPGIGITNLILEPGNANIKDVIADTKKGILMESTGDRPNISTGDFSGLIMQGNIIENGKVKDPLNETMFGMNLLDLFKNIVIVSKENKVYGHYKAPYVKVDDVQIIGSAS